VKPSGGGGSCQRRGNEKSRVERAIRYIRTGSFAAREFEFLNDATKAIRPGMRARQWSI
jgi:hypothetical protein